MSPCIRLVFSLKQVPMPEVEQHAHECLGKPKRNRNGNASGASKGPKPEAASAYAQEFQKQEKVGLPGTAFCATALEHRGDELARPRYRG